MRHVMEEHSVITGMSSVFAAVEVIAVELRVGCAATHVGASQPPIATEVASSQVLLEMQAREATADGLGRHCIGHLGLDELVASLAIESDRRLLHVRSA